MKQIIQYQADDGFVGSEEECFTHDTVSRLVKVVDKFHYSSMSALSMAEAIYIHGQEILDILYDVYDLESDE